MIVLLVATALVASTVVISFGFGTTDSAAEQVGSESTFIRVFHGSADAPPVDVYVGGELVVADVSFGELTDTELVTSGNQSLMITEAGNRNAVLFNGTVDLEPVTSYTIAASSGAVQEAGPGAENGAATETPFGQETETENATPTETPVDQETENDTPTETPFGQETATATETDAGNATQALEPVVLVDNATDPGMDQAALRLVHLSSNTSAVTVVNAETGETIVENLSYQGSTGYMTLPDGEYTLEVRQAANETDDGTGVTDTPTATETPTAVTETPTGTATETVTETPVETATETPTGTAAPAAAETNQTEPIATFNVTLEGGNAYTGFAVGVPEGDTAEEPISLIVVTDPVKATDTPTQTETETETEAGTPVPIGTETPTETPVPVETETPTTTAGGMNETATPTGTPV